MAVREKTLTRSFLPVKHSATGSTQPARPTRSFWTATALFTLSLEGPPLLSSRARHRIQPEARNSSPQRVSASNTCHTKPISDSTDPPNASPHETDAAPADTPQIPPPLHTASAPDTAPGSAPADQWDPHRPAAPAWASSHSSSARTASY